MNDSTSDEQKIKKLTDELYDSICFRTGDRPIVEKLWGFFMPDGRLINNSGTKPVIMSVDDFITAYTGRIESGNITAFQEKERSGITEVFGKIAHRFSCYESRFDPDDEQPFSIGINSIQFIKIDDVWRVSCMVWNDQTDNMKIPEKYL